MKKFINKVDEILTESLTGLGNAHNDILEVRLKPDFIAFNPASLAKQTPVIAVKKIKKIVLKAPITPPTLINR